MNDTEMRFNLGGTVRALPDRRLEVLAVPFGSPTDLDGCGTYFTSKTDFMIETGDRRPALYFHGFAPNKQMTARPAPIGVATATRCDEVGLWMEVELKATPMADRVWTAAEAGTCRASTGAVNYLTRFTKEGEAEVWPIGELSLLDEGLGRHPANSKAIAIPLRASFDAIDLEFPEVFGENTAEPQEEVVSKPPTPKPLAPEPLVLTRDWGDRFDRGETSMATEVELAVEAALKARDAAEAAKKAEKEAMRASIIEEMKGEPQHRALFSIGKESPKGLTPEQKDTYDFCNALRHGDSRLAPKDAKRILEEDATGLPLVPDDMLNQIHELLQAVSFGRAAGMRIYTTDKSILNIPAQATAMAASPAIVEEAVYLVNEPTLATVPVEVAKHGGFVDASEEFLEDQSLFQPWLIREIARSMGLAENVDVAASLLATAGTAIATAHTLTDDEVMAWYFRLPRVYRDGAQFFMSDATQAYLRSMTILTPRAYGDFGSFSGGDWESFMGKKLYTDANFPDLQTAHAVQIASFANLNESIAFVERRGIKILADPYTFGLNGIVRFYFSARWCTAVVNAAALTNVLGIV